MIRFFDLFAGIGGFRSGLEAVGGFECVGHCEIDRYANQAYNAIYDIKPQEVYFEDVRKIDPDTMPDIDQILISDKSEIPCATHTRIVLTHAAPSHTETDAPAAL